MSSVPFADVSNFDLEESKPNQPVRELFRFKTLCSLSQNVTDSGELDDIVLSCPNGYQTLLEFEGKPSEGIPKFILFSQEVFSIEWVTIRYYIEDRSEADKGVKNLAEKFPYFRDYELITPSYEIQYKNYEKGLKRYLYRKSRWEAYKNFLNAQKKPTIRPRLTVEQELEMMQHFKALYSRCESKIFYGKAEHVWTNRTSNTCEWGAKVSDIFEYGLEDYEWFAKFKALGGWISEAGKICYEKRLDWTYFQNKYNNGWIKKYPHYVSRFCLNYPDMNLDDETVEGLKKHPEWSEKVALFIHRGAEQRKLSYSLKNTKRKFPRTS